MFIIYSDLVKLKAERQNFAVGKMDRNKYFHCHRFAGGLSDRFSYFFID